VKGGRAISAHDKAVLDVWYLGQASLWLDLKILAQTLPMMVFGERTEPGALHKAWDELAGTAIMATDAWPAGFHTPPERGAECFSHDQDDGSRIVGQPRRTAPCVP